MFAAWTTAELLEQWYAPVPDWITTVAHVDARLGGSYQISFGPPPGGDRYTETGEYTAFEPGVLLGMRIDVRGADYVISSRAEVRFRQDGEWTEVTVTETDYSDASGAADHAEGWQRTLEHLITALGDPVG